MSTSLIDQALQAAAAECDREKTRADKAEARIAELEAALSVHLKSTELFEQDARIAELQHEVDAALAERDSLRKQRDELLEALERLDSMIGVIARSTGLRCCSRYNERSFDNHDQNCSWRVAHAAIDHARTESDK